MVLKKDYPYILLAVALSTLIATAVSNPGESAGTFALLGLIGVAVVMVIIIYPSLGANILLIVVFSNISAELTDNGLPGVIKPLVAIVFGSILVRNYYVGQIPVNRPKTKRIEFFLILYFFVVTASYVVASDKDLAIERATDLAKDIVIIYCILFCLRNSQEWKVTIIVMVAVTTVLSLLGIYQIATENYVETFFGLSQIDADQRVGGPINEPNMWGQVIISIIPFAIFGFLRSSSTTKLTYAMVLVVLLIELLNTYSRGGYLAFFVVIFLVLFFFTRFNPMMMFAIILIGFLAFPFLPPSYVERLQSITSLSSGDENTLYQDSSFRGRTSEMLAGFAMFTEHPILGIGAANYPKNYQKYAQIVGIETRTEEREAHSLYVEILAETGILGILSFMGLVVSLFRGLSNIKSNLRHTHYYSEWVSYISAVQVSLIAYLFASIFLHGPFLRFFWIYVALVMALIQILYEKINSSDSYHQGGSVEPSA